MKQFTVLVLIGISTLSFGQTEKGNISFGGAIFGQYTAQEYDASQNMDKSNHIYFSFRPKIGYFIFENLSIDLTPQFSYNKSSYTYIDQPDQKVNSLEYGLNLSIRNYFGKNKLKPFVGFGVSVNQVERNYIAYFKFSDNTDYTELKGNDLEFEVAPNLFGGLAIFVNDKVSVDLLTDCSYTWLKNETDTGLPGDVNPTKEKRLQIYFGTGITVLF